MKHVKLFEEFVNGIYESKVKSQQPDQVTTIRVGLEIYDGWPNLVRESNDSLTEGKASSMLSKLGKGVEHETVASMLDQDEDVSKEIMTAMKSLGCSAEDCVVIGDYHTDDWNKVLRVAKSSGVKFIEVKDDNGSAIVFSMNESNGFVNESKVTSILSKLGKWTPVDADEDLLDGLDYTSVSSFVLNTNSDLDNYGVVVNVYDDKDFSIFFDSTPVALSSHTTQQAREMSSIMKEYPLPLSKLTKKELDTIIDDLMTEYLG